VIDIRYFNLFQGMIRPISEGEFPDYFDLKRSAGSIAFLVITNFVRIVFQALKEAMTSSRWRLGGRAN
jgi:hypothetical protein